MEKDTYEFDNFNEWVAEARRCGGDVWDRTHDTVSPNGKHWVAHAWMGEIGEFDKTTSTGYITV